MFARIAMCVVVSVVVSGALTGCEHRVSVPPIVRGAWGADCTAPFVAFNEDSIHIYPDNASYALKQVTFNGNDLTVKYDNAQGSVTETYLKSGETLRIENGTYAGVQTTWHKQAMQRCPTQ